MDITALFATAGDPQYQEDLLHYIGGHIGLMSDGPVLIDGLSNHPEMPGWLAIHIDICQTEGEALNVALNNHCRNLIQ